MISIPKPGRQAATIATAAVGALLVWAIAVPLADVDLSVHSGGSDQPSRPVGPVAVAVVAVIAGLAAAGLAALLNRTTSRPRRNWAIIAVATLLLSLLGPLGAVSVGAGVTLAAMHLLVGATLILGLSGALASENSSSENSILGNSISESLASEGQISEPEGQER